MLFEKEKYYKYINSLEKMVNFMYIIYAILFAIIGLMIGKGLGFLLGIVIGLLLATSATLNAKIKIQKMKWEIDMYMMLKK